MKEIALTNGGVALVDDADFDMLTQWKWRRAKAGRAVYAVRSEQLPDGRGTTIMMHRVILGLGRGQRTMVDHRDSDGLNNQRYNIRPASCMQNGQNKRKPVNNTSGFKGVCWLNDRKKWWARIRVQGRIRHVGRFDDKESAARAYAEAARRYFGDFANSEVQCG